MRNLKRVLSLTLASVMLMGMMVMGSSAAAGYDDVSKDDNVEAIEVLQTIEVMVGDERGFGPERPVNRAEMAVVMGKLLNLDYNYYASSCPFTDVYDWAQGWVGACYANKIVSGRGDGIYDPGATVTAVEAASMLMRALGYFQYQNDYAAGFELATVTQGTKIDIFDNVGSSASEPMTRNQVAQMVLNALQCGTVQPDGNTINLTTPDGGVITGKVNYVFVTSNKAYATAISSTNASSMGSYNNAPIVELGEQLYNGELKLYGEGDSISDRVWDVFGRPARTWEYMGQEIGTYEKKELTKETYTAKVTGQTLYELLGKSTIDTYDFKITIDGVDTRDASAEDILGSALFSKDDLYRTNKEAVGRTGNGVLTKVYVDTEFEKNSNNYWVYISIINTYLAKANEDYDTKNDDVSLNVWRLDKIQNEYVKSTVQNIPENKSAREKDYEEIDAKGEDFSLVKDVQKDDLYLVTVAEGEIQTIESPEILDRVTVDAFKLFDHVTTGGQQYDHATTARYDVEAIENWTSIDGALNLKELTYNVVLDEYGYLIGLERNEDPDQYVFLTGIEAGASNLYAKQVDANIIHMDGTMETVKVDMTKSKWGNPGEDDQTLGGNLTRNLSQLNTWCTYSVSNSGVYTLRRVAVATTANLTGDNVKAAQYAQDVALFNDNNAPDYNKSINTKRVSLKASSSGSEYVYGNDETVYLTVSLEKVVVDDKDNYNIYDKTANDWVKETCGANRWIIDDVETVVTGVKNANLVVTELGVTDAKYGYGYPEAEIYTLYDEDGIVIAAVVIGEDDGASSTYAYIHTSGLDEESYRNTSSTRSGEDEWTWTRKAIVKGEIVTLKEVGDNPEYLSGLVQGRWYEIKYDGNGNVRRAELIPNTGAESKYPITVGLVEESVNDKDTVVLRDATTIDGLRFEKGTLYTNTKGTRGFSVDPDVKTVLILASKAGYGNKGWDKNVKLFDDTTDGYNGYTGLEKALREMNDNDGAYRANNGAGEDYNDVEIAAILENGRATTIIINDKTPAPENKPGGTSKPTQTGDIVITYLTSQHSGSTFYVNGTELTADDFTSIVGGKTFTVKSTDEVAVVNTAFNKDGTTTVDTGKTVTGTMDATLTAVTFKTSKSITLAAKTAIVGDVVEENNISAKITVIDKTDNDKAVEVITPDKVEVTAGSKIKLTFSLPSGYELNDGTTLGNNLSTATGVVGSSEYDISSSATLAAESDPGTYTWTSTADANVTAVISADAASVNVTIGAKPDSTKSLTGGTGADGYSFKGNSIKGGSNVGKLSTGSAEVIEFKLQTAPDYVKEVKVTYTVSNTTLTGEQTYTGTPTSGVITVTTAAAKATGDAVIDIKSVEVTKVGYDTVASATHQIDTLAGTPVVGTEIDLPDLDVKAVTGNVVQNSKAKITFTVSGIVGGEKTFTTEELTANASNTYEIRAAGMQGGAKPKITPDGSKAVTITIDSVEITSVQATYTSAITGGTDIVNSADKITTAGTANAVAVTGGKFTVTLTLTGAGGSGDPTAGQYLVTGGADAKIYDIDATNKTITVEVTASDTATYNFVVQKVG